MADDAIEQVFETCHIVIHNGADASFHKPYSSLRRTNFESTKTILRLALERGHVCHFHYVSTAGITSLLNCDLYEESLRSLPLIQSHVDVSNRYFLSKWASELYLEQASATTGMPVTIHRPTVIVGENAPHLDLVSNILYYSMQIGMVPSM
ncbi:hypothetical protein PG985_013234 [Apiospora marii]|uniref:uncharacterized protein n=1 Tax=Apiospora marii TaxID=335849 RepID=UPI00312E0396